MGYRELTKLFSSEQLPAEIIQFALERTPVMQRLIDDFLTGYYHVEGIKPKAIDEIAWRLSLGYFTLCHKYIKPVVDERINRYKMASLLELIIVKEQVLTLETKDEFSNRMLNAQFGTSAAFSLLNCMISDATNQLIFDTNNVGINDRVELIIDDHLTWLTSKPPHDLAIFINAQFYELMEVLAGADYQGN